MLKAGDVLMISGSRGMNGKKLVKMRHGFYAIIGVDACFKGSSSYIVHLKRIYTSATLRESTSTYYIYVVYGVDGHREAARLRSDITYTEGIECYITKQIKCVRTYVRDDT
jgi:hypothetical protein